MKTGRLLKLLSRVVAIPVAWCMAAAPGNAAVPVNQPVAEQPRSAIPPDRLLMLQSLLGSEVVPSDLIDTQAGPTTLVFPVIVAGADQTGSPPSPPPP
jgi:hypothetical protein